jgi:hypothetical protein
MRIEWLNAEFTEAILTRGWWWRRQRAHVQRSDAYWRYQPSGDRVGYDLDQTLDHAMYGMRARAQRQANESNWTPVKLPLASARYRTSR